VSLLWLFRKFADPIAARQEEEDLRRQREAWPGEEDPEDTDIVLGELPPSAPPPRFACRLCGHEAADGSYCPECLAPTMERITEQ
jgi:hypothetical protein